MNVPGGPKMLIGYDVESCAIGESLSRIKDPANQLYQAMDSASIEEGCRRILSLHRDLGVAGTVFACGKTVLHALPTFEKLVDEELIDIQQHTYSHVLFKEDVQLGATFPASPTPALRFEVRMASTVLREYLGIECIGLRTPHGYAFGLSDRPDLVEVIRSEGIRFVSSWARDPEGNSPAPLTNQPHWYGGCGVLETPFQHWMDVAWFELEGLTSFDEFTKVLREAVDWIVDNEAVYGTCFHDWGLLRYQSEESGWLRNLVEYALESGVEVMSYTDYYRQAEALAGGDGP